MVRPITRNQRAATIFNNAFWPVHYDTTLIDALQMRTLHIDDLSSPNVFEDVISRVVADMTRRLGRSFTLHEVKIRIDSIRRRFYQFMLFTTLPGVNFNRMTNRLRFDAQYNHAGESTIRRYFRHYGFPYYETCNDVFEYKNAAPINFHGVQGYNPDEPIEIEDSDNVNNGNNEHVSTEVDSGNNNAAADSVVNPNNAMVVYQGNNEPNNENNNVVVDWNVDANNVDDEWDEARLNQLEHQYGWGTEPSSSSGGHSSDSQNTWSR